MISHVLVLWELTLEGADKREVVERVPVGALHPGADAFLEGKDVVLSTGPPSRALILCLSPGEV